MSPSELSSISRGNELEADEAIVIIHVNYLTPQTAGGILNFYYDGAQEIRGTSFVRAPQYWQPMFSIPTYYSGTPWLFKVKAGSISFGSVNRGSSIANLSSQLRAYVRPQTVTYIGEVRFRMESDYNFSYNIGEDTATINTLRLRYPALFEHYPLVTNLLTKKL